jgi:hypothetical protein
VANAVPFNSLYSAPYACAFSRDNKYFYMAIRQAPGYMVTYSASTYLPVNVVDTVNIFPQGIAVQP